jgi:hypothetical protein
MKERHVYDLRKKILTYNPGYDIVRKQSKRAFFLCLKKPFAKFKRSCATREIGGGYCARKNHIGLYGLQTTQLQHNQGKEVTPGQNGNKEVL